MCEVLARSGLFLICVFFAAATTTMAATTPMLETTTEGDECNWTRTDGMPFKTDQSCYLFISEIKSFYEANKSCEDEGTHLVSIGNEKENAVVSMMISTDVWIGLYRLTNNNCAGNACTDWMWLDGSDPAYFNWGNFHANPAQCVFMKEAGKWEHVRFCSENQSFVCEKNIPLTTSTSEPTTMMITSPMADTSVSNSESDRFSIFMGIGVFVGIFVMAIIAGSVVCLMKRRHARQMTTSKVTTDSDVSTDMGNSENVGVSASLHSLVISQQAMPEGVYVNSITTDSTVSTGNYEDDTSNRTAYEEVANYTAVSPEYTPLQFTDSTHTYVNR